MTNSSILTGDTTQINTALEQDIPVFLWLSDGGSVPSDVRKAIEQAISKYRSKIAVYLVDTTSNPDLAQRFDVGRHPVIVGWHNGDIVSRRSRPWATDVAGLLEKLAGLVPKREDPNSQKEITVADKPVIVTDETFQKEVLESDIPVLIDFWAEWCGPCRMVAPILEKLAGEYAGKVKIAKVDVDANPQLAGGFRIMSIPTLMFVKEGKIVGQAAGAAPEPALRDALEQLIALEIPA